MTYEEFLEQTALEVWQMWNSGEVHWRDGFPQEVQALHWGMSTWALGYAVWDKIEAVWGKYGSKV